MAATVFPRLRHREFSTAQDAERPFKMGFPWWDMLKHNWHLGFTAFGGPPVHFQIFHKKFVDELHWIDEQMYQELFALCQALPGPGSTKMLFIINSIHGGILTGLLAFLVWSLPGALGMYGLSLGIARVGDVLPGPVYALLSGLNAATVGIIALAGVQLSRKAITDKLTRCLVFFGGVAGMLYNALWYFPVLMAAAGIFTVMWDTPSFQRAKGRLGRKSKDLRSSWRKRQSQEQDQSAIAQEETAKNVDHSINDTQGQLDSSVQLRRVGQMGQESAILPVQESDPVAERNSSESRTADRQVPSAVQVKAFSWKIGAVVIGAFLLTFLAVMLVRGLLKNPPRGMSLFANLYLAGTIIFGGGPVVIPLLREYIVSEGWVSARDFLLGLALIQSFPGPNFNFAVYLGSLATVGTSLPSFAGALLGYLGIFLPGLFISYGAMGLWRVLRTRRWVTSLLRGVNAAAVGLVYTAVYRLWRVGVVDANYEAGNSLESDPWWVAITATSFVGGTWFGLNPPMAILLGGVMGLVWYGVVQA
ncbi:MAG: hypothetical protein M1817_001905 [Caeruleum heppii]|nr:MAG: hypothetical protein M1817_001905 [Caeruleum heppii]